MTREERLEILTAAQEQMAEALQSIERIARLDPNKEAYVYEQLDSLINTPSNRYDQSLLTWIEELYEQSDLGEDEDEECPEEGSEEERALLGE